MRNVLLVGLVVIVSLVPAFGQQSGWVKVTSETGKFSVLMPGTQAPEEKAQTVATETKVPEAAPYSTHLWIAPTDKGIFLVGYVAYAPGYHPSAQSELEANRDNFVKGINAKLISSSATSLGAFPGVEFICESDTRTFKTRVFMVGSRPYQVTAGTNKGIDDSANVEKFLSSFKVTQ